MKLTNVARASLEELLCDYEDFLRQNKFSIWCFDDHRRKEIIGRRFQTADELIRWVKEQHVQTKTEVAELAANAVLTLISITCMLLSRQLAAQAASFQEKGGFTERLHRVRKQSQKMDMDKNGR